MEMLGADKKTLSACSLVVREFTFVALCRLGRHISVNTVCRLRECSSLISKGSALQHVNSLHLGTSSTKKRGIFEKDWDAYLIILEAFARRRTLTRLWLSQVPFYFSSFYSSERKKGETIRNIVVSLAATVKELVLYCCHFSCYVEMISLVRAFPLCTSLDVRNCFTRKTPGANAFAELPRHTLHISNLKLESSSKRGFLIDVSGLIKDAALDISSLTSFRCDMNTADVTRHTMMTAIASPTGWFKLVCGEAQGFDGTSGLSEKPRVLLALIPWSKF